MPKIKASDLLTRRSLSVDSGGVVFQETMLFGGVQQWAFREIDCVLLSGKGVLSLQVGWRVFSIPTNPNNRKHQEAIDTLVRELNANA